MTETASPITNAYDAADVRRDLDTRTAWRYRPTTESTYSHHPHIAQAMHLQKLYVNISRSVARASRSMMDRWRCSITNCRRALKRWSRPSQRPGLWHEFAAQGRRVTRSSGDTTCTDA